MLLLGVINLCAIRRLVCKYKHTIINEYRILGQSLSLHSLPLVAVALVLCSQDAALKAFNMLDDARNYYLAEVPEKECSRRRLQSRKSLRSQLRHDTRRPSVMLRFRPRLPLGAQQTCGQQQMNARDRSGRHSRASSVGPASRTSSKGSAGAGVGMATAGGGADLVASFNASAGAVTFSADDSAAGSVAVAAAAFGPSLEQIGERERPSLASTLTSEESDADAEEERDDQYNDDAMTFRVFPGASLTDALRVTGFRLLTVHRETTVAELTDDALQAFYATDFVERSRVQLWLSFADRGRLNQRPLTQPDELLFPSLAHIRRESIRQFYTARITVQLIWPVAQISQVISIFECQMPNSRFSLDSELSIV